MRDYQHIIQIVKERVGCATTITAYRRICPKSSSKT